MADSAQSWRPAERARFDRRYRDDPTGATVENWQAWVKDCAPVPAIYRRDGTSRTSTTVDDALPLDAAPDAQVVFMTRQAVEKSGGKLSYYQAQREVLKAHPGLADAYRLQPGTK